MTDIVHSEHPPVQEAGLADGCVACAYIAEEPTKHLDDETLDHLATLATSPDRLALGRSENELVAAAKILTLLEQVGRLAFVSPEVVLGYLRDKWSVPVSAPGPLVEPDAPSDPVCTCRHRLSEHREEDGPGHAGCRAQVVIEDADSSKGEAVYEECDCAGFVSADLETEPEPV